VYGSVRDAQGMPVPGASVHLETKQGSLPPVVSDADGKYRYAAIEPGLYTIGAEKSGYSESRIGPFALNRGQARSIDIVLNSKPVAEVGTSAAKPEFYDEPQFIVAGVADTASHGGHGSDRVGRTAQSLAADISGSGKSSQLAGASAGEESALRAEIARTPQSFAANRRLGILLLQSGKAEEAVTYLERAHSFQPSDEASARELAQVYTEIGRYKEAESTLTALLAKKDAADLHHLLGDIQEKQKNPVAAVHEYQRAAELEASETNLFDWGAELLTHRALEPSISVFKRGNRMYPQSARMLVGLGVAWYASGSFAQAVEYLCQAADINPADPNPYLVLGRIQVEESASSQEILKRMERFAQLHPQNAQANYYYAVSLLKQGRAGIAPDVSAKIESLLDKAVRLDSELAPGFLQLGILYEQRSELAKAIAAYEQAAHLDPQLGDARYRLAQAYRRTGEKVKAEQELASYKEISRRAEEQVEQQAREIPQFVYTLRDSKTR
jgi:tetratricopeptide (TPR) repeat protein